jgi:hypothetical protein
MRIGVPVTSMLALQDATCCAGKMICIANILVRPSCESLALQAAICVHLIFFCLHESYAAAACFGLHRSLQIVFPRQLFYTLLATLHACRFMRCCCPAGLQGRHELEPCGGGRAHKAHSTASAGADSGVDSNELHVPVCCAWPAVRVA